MAAIFSAIGPARSLSASERLIWREPARPLKLPIAAYDGQDFEPLFRLMAHNRPTLEPCALRLATFEDATVIVCPGYDGLIIDRAGRAVRETTYYGPIFWNAMSEGVVEVEAAPEPLDEVCIAFDSSWFIYFHFMFFTLGVAALAERLLPEAARIIVPDYAACAGARPVSVSEPVFRRVEQTVSPGRLARLRDGAYRARRVHLLFIDEDRPADVTLHPLFPVVCKNLAASFPASPSVGRRLFVLRSGRGGAGRATDAEEGALARAAARFGFTPVRLETLGFEQQAAAFRDAEAVIAAHGSGLANLMFSGPRTKVLELQTEIDMPGMLRPWFYQIAAAKGQDYAFLQRERGEFTAAHLTAALQRLGLRPRRLPFLKAEPLPLLGRP